jgi:hypothetical protein
MGGLTYIRIFTAVLAVAAAALTPAVARGAVFDAASDFSLSANPNGAWSYGYQDSLGGPLNAYEVATADWRGTSNLEAWTTDRIGVDPNISHNPTDAELSFVTVHVPPNGLTLHPGPGGQPSVLRWTAPAADAYAVTAAFRGNDETTTDVHVLHNDASVFDGRVTTYGEGPSFSTVLTVAAGDTIDFAVGNGSNGYFNDSTGLSATITPLPEPLGMMALSLAALGLMRRPRRGTS